MDEEDIKFSDRAEVDNTVVLITSIVDPNGFLTGSHYLPLRRITADSVTEA